MTTLATALSDTVAPGTLGFLVVFGLAVALYFLFRSMSKHLRKVDAAARDAATAATEERARPGAAGDGAVDSAPAGSGTSRTDS